MSGCSIAAVTPPDPPPRLPGPGTTFSVLADPATKDRWRRPEWRLFMRSAANSAKNRHLAGALSYLSRSNVISGAWSGLACARAGARERLLYVFCGVGWTG